MRIQDIYRRLIDRLIYRATRSFIAYTDAQFSSADNIDGANPGGQNGANENQSKSEGQALLDRLAEELKKGQGVEVRLDVL